MNRQLNAIARPLPSLVVTWLLMFPLIYLCAYGAFSLDHADYNNPLAAQGGSLLAGHSKVTAAVEILIAYGISMALLVQRAGKLRPLLTAYKSLLYLPALALASTLWSQDPLRSAMFAILSAIATLMGFWLYQRFSDSEQIDLFFLVGVIAIIASYVLVLLTPSVGISSLAGKGEWLGIYNMKNRCAVNLVFLLTPALFWVPRTLLQKILQVTYVFLNLFFIVKTQSRTGWLMAALLISWRASFALARRLRQRERILVIALTLIFSILVGGILLGNYREIAFALGKDPTLTGRVGIWKACIDSAIKSPWLGFGYSAFWLGMKGEAANTMLSVGYMNLANAENGVLQLWLEIGLVGVALLLAYLYKALRNGVTCLLSCKDDYTGWLLSVLLLTFLSLVDGEKFMFPSTLDWPLFILIYIGLSERATDIRRRRANLAPTTDSETVRDQHHLATNYAATPSAGMPL